MTRIEENQALLSDRLDSRVSEMTGLIKDMEASQATLNDQTQLWSSRTQGNTQSIIEAKQSLEALERKHAMQSSALKALGDQYVRLARELEATGQMARTTSSDVGGVKRDLAGLATRSDSEDKSLRQAVLTLQQSGASLKSENEETRGALARMRTELRTEFGKRQQSTAAEVEAISKEMAGLISSLGSVRQALLEVENNGKTLRRDATANAGAVERLRRDLLEKEAALRAELLRLNTRLAELEKQEEPDAEVLHGSGATGRP